MFVCVCEWVSEWVWLCACVCVCVCVCVLLLQEIWFFCLLKWIDAVSRVCKISFLFWSRRPSVLDSFTFWPDFINAYLHCVTRLLRPWGPIWLQKQKSSFSPLHYIDLSWHASIPRQVAWQGSVHTKRDLLMPVMSQSSLILQEIFLLMPYKCHESCTLNFILLWCRVAILS